MPDSTFVHELILSGSTLSSGQGNIEYRFAWPKILYIGTDGNYYTRGFRADNVERVGDVVVVVWRIVVSSSADFGVDGVNR
jgi:hypothetical protein